VIFEFDFRKNIESYGMNQWLKKTTRLASAPKRRILGMMSGTSADGLDLALCDISGHGLSTRVEILVSETVPFSNEIREAITALAFDPKTPLGDVLLLNSRLGRLWCDMLLSFLIKHNLKPDEIDVLASHGQTILHMPKRLHKQQNGGNITLQIVDGDVLAHRTGILTISDFRQKPIAAGMEGAPLAPLAECLLFSDPAETRVLLNLGGIANFTLLPAGVNKPVIPLSGDTGPANTLMDAMVREYYPGLDFDKGGEIAASGKPDQALLETMREHPYFSEPFPKSTGQETFNPGWVRECIKKSGNEIKPADLITTLTMLTARSVAEAIQRYTIGPFTLYVSGGGWHNQTLKGMISDLLPKVTVRSSAELGIDSDAKEAVLFAVLANECLAGEGWLLGDGRRFTTGKISVPD